MGLLYFDQGLVFLIEKNTVLLKPKKGRYSREAMANIRTQSEKEGPDKIKNSVAACQKTMCMIAKCIKT